MKLPGVESAAVSLKSASADIRLKADNKFLTPQGAAQVTKAAIEPVWWLPGVAERFGVTESDLRRVL